MEMKNLTSEEKFHTGHYTQRFIAELPRVKIYFYTTKNTLQWVLSCKHLQKNLIQISNFGEYQNIP